MTHDVEGLERRLAYLEQRLAIDDVYLRYMRGFDRNDVALLRSAFWPDAQINYGEEVNTLESFIERHLGVGSHERRPGTHKDLGAYGHLLTNISVEIADDIAHSEAYVTALFRQSDGGISYAGGVTIIGGRYVDRLDHRDGEWRIAIREFVEHFRSVTEQLADPRPAGLIETQWDRRDPSYRRPLERRPTTSPAESPRSSS